MSLGSIRWMNDNSENGVSEGTEDVIVALGAN